MTIPNNPLQQCLKHNFSAIIYTQTDIIHDYNIINMK